MTTNTRIAGGKIRRLFMARFCFFVALFSVARANFVAQAEVITLGADRDTTIFQDNPTNSYGNGAGIFSGNNNQAKTRHGLLSFDLTAIPAGSTISAVQLTLTLGTIGGGATSGMIPRSFGLFAVTQNWGEGSNGSATSFTGSGSLAADGDATWNAPLSPSPLWQNAGGDHRSTASATLSNVKGVVNDAYTWTSTTQLVSDVQGWANNSATNFGWELINGQEGSTDMQSVYAFYSSEWGETARRPQLQVTYLPAPEPAPAALLALAWLPLLASRRKILRPA